MGVNKLRQLWSAMQDSHKTHAMLQTGQEQEKTHF